MIFSTRYLIISSIGIFSLFLFSLFASVTSQCTSGLNAVFTMDKISPIIYNDYISFSLEVDIALGWVGAVPDTRKSFTNLMKQLGRPVLRIGGDSTDYSWYNPTNLPFPPYKTRAFRYNITDIDIYSFKSGVESYNGSLVIGVNFRNETGATWAINHMLALDRIIGINSPSILAIEIGNEVDFYGGNRDRDPSTWTVEAYYANWLDYIKQIRAALPHLRQAFTQAATYGGNIAWFGDTPDFVDRYYENMVTIALHHYPDGTGNSTTMAYQMSDSISRRMAAILTNGTSGGNLYEKITQKYGIGIVVGEGNSNSEPGQPGVCDSFGVNMWGIDAMFASASAGLRRFHWHTHYLDLRTPIFFFSDIPLVRPVYYTLRFFAMATRGNTQIIAANGCTVDPLVKIWGVITENGDIRVSVIHKNVTATDPYPITIDLSKVLSPPPSQVYLIRLLGNIEAKENITLANQTYTSTQDGLPIGNFAYETVSLIKGVYQFTIHPMTAVLLSTSMFPEAIEIEKISE